MLWVLLPPAVQRVLPGSASPSGSGKGIAGVDAGACSLRGTAQEIPWEPMLIQHLEHCFFSVSTGNDKCFPSFDRSVPDITCLYVPESLFSRQYMGLSPMKANCTIRRRYPANLIRYIYLCLRGFFF